MLLQFFQDEESVSSRLILANIKNTKVETKKNPAESQLVNAGISD